MRVVEPATEEVIVAGTVHRSAEAPDTGLSAGMRLWQRGITFHSDGWRFEPLESLESKEDSGRIPIEPVHTPHEYS